MGVRVGLLEDFVHDHDAVLEPFIGYEVMSIGMREGRFAGRKLSDFINDAKLDYLNAKAPRSRSTCARSGSSRPA